MKTVCGFSALLFIGRAIFPSPVITEVEPNPPGATTAMPGDLTHEFIEIFNPGPETLNFFRCHFVVSSAGSSTVNTLTPVIWTGDSLNDVGGDSTLVYDSLIPPGGFGLVLSRGYVSAPSAARYAITSGTRIFTSENKYLRSSAGLANGSTFLRLYAGDGTLVSTFNSFGSTSLDPGEAYSWQRVHPDSGDGPENWQAAPPTPGASFPFSSLRPYAKTVVINEFMCDPQTGHSEWVELYNPGSDTVSLRGWSLSGEEGGFDITHSPGFIPPGGYAVLAQDPSLDPAVLDALLCPLFKPEGWDPLLRDADVIVLRDPSGTVADSIQYLEGWLPVKKGFSVERQSPLKPAAEPGNWRHSLHASGATPGYKNSSADAVPIAFAFSVVNRRFSPGCGCESEKLLVNLNLPKEGTLTLKIFDLKGRQINTLFDGRVAPGILQRTWEGRSAQRRLLPSGTYLLYCDYRAPGGSKLKKVPVVLAARD